MKRYIKKKAAIQMSMQTIIVVVIGVTLLTLGLKFVYDTFGNIGGQQEKVSKLTEKQISQLYGESDEAIYIPRDDIKMSQGDSDSIDIVLRNVEPGLVKAGLKLVVDQENIPSKADADDVKSWFTFKKSKKELDEGEGSEYKVVLDVPKKARLGTYLVTFEIDCSSPENDICGEEADFVFEVTA